MHSAVWNIVNSHSIDYVGKRIDVYPDIKDLLYQYCLRYVQRQKKKYYNSINKKYYEPHTDDKKAIFS